MSCVILPDTHINTLLTYYKVHSGSPYRNVDDYQKAGRILIAENLRGHQACFEGRHQHPEWVDEYQFNEINDNATEVQILKACQYYEYQAGYSEGYEQSEAAKIISKIRERAIYNLAGYNEAEFQISGKLKECQTKRLATA